MFKKILIGLLLLIAVFCAYVAMLPSDYRIERSLKIDGKPDQVFAQVNDLRKFNEWSPWAKLDPNSKAEFSGAEQGEGAAFSWAGNSEVGKGKMTIIESSPDERIAMKMDFKEPMEDTATVEFLFKPDGESTDVTWAIFGQDSFMEKAICVFLDRDKMVGDMFNKGLANLKASVEQP